MTTGPFTAPELSPVRAAGDEPGAGMLLHVVWRASASIHRLDDVRHLQATAIAVMERVAQNPRTRAHGIFADVRGGFALVEVTRPRELMELFAGLRDLAELEVHPVAETADAVTHLRGLLVTEDLLG